MNREKIVKTAYVVVMELHGEASVNAIIDMARRISGRGLQRQFVCQWLALNRSVEGK